MTSRMRDRGKLVPATFWIALVLIGLEGGCQFMPISNPSKGADAQVATGPDAEPIYALTNDELTRLFSNVSVTWANDDPDRSSVETFSGDGRYVLSRQGDFVLKITSQGRFWIQDGELCREIPSDGSGPICRRFGRSVSGAVYELPADGREKTPRRYEFTNLEGKPKP